jgi:hypothetical protein
VRQAALIVLALAACHHAPAQPPRATPPPAADVRVACTTSEDCDAIAVPGGFNCIRACVKGSCQIEATTTTLGAGPCYGEEVGAGGGGEDPGQATVALMCDSAAGLYCDLESHRCATVKPDGGACRRDVAECRLGSYCDPRTHVCATQKLGDTCTGGGTCGLDGFCDDATHVCTASKPDGSACTTFVECLSHQCDNHVCVRPPPKACTANN